MGATAESLIIYRFAIDTETNYKSISDWIENLTLFGLLVGWGAAFFYVWVVAHKRRTAWDDVRKAMLDDGIEDLEAHDSPLPIDLNPYAYSALANDPTERCLFNNAKMRRRWLS